MKENTEKLIINFKPSYKQHLAWNLLTDKKTRAILYGGAAGGGKSYLGSAWKIRNRLLYKNSRGLIARKKRVDLIDSTIVTFNKVLDLFNLKSGTHYKFTNRDHQMNYEFRNGSIESFRQIPYLPADPDYNFLGSKEYTDVWLEEGNEMSEKAFEVVSSRIRWNLPLYGIIDKCLITCNPDQNWVYELFYNPYRESKLPIEYGVVLAKVQDNPDEEFVKAYLSNLEKIKDPALRARLLEGDWDYANDDSILYLPNKLNNLFFNTHVYNPTDKKYITCDTSRYGDNETVIYLWQGMTVLNRYVLTHDRELIDQTSQTVKFIDELAIRNQVLRENIIIDELGAGASGVIDGLSYCTPFVGSSSPIEHDNLTIKFANLKAQCAYKLSEYINTDSIYSMIIDRDLQNKIKTEAKAHKKFNYDSMSKLDITTKKIIKSLLRGKSPDDWDNMIMRMLPIVKVDNSWNGL